MCYHPINSQFLIHPYVQYWSFVCNTVLYFCSCGVLYCTWLLSFIIFRHQLGIITKRISLFQHRQNFQPWNPLTSLNSPFLLALRPSGACSWMVVLLITSIQHSSSSAPSGRTRQYTCARAYTHTQSSKAYRHPVQIQRQGINKHYVH